MGNPSPPDPFPKPFPANSYGEGGMLAAFLYCAAICTYSMEGARWDNNVRLLSYKGTPYALARSLRPSHLVLVPVVSKFVAVLWLAYLIAKFIG